MTWREDRAERLCGARSPRVASRSAQIVTESVVEVEGARRQQHRGRRSLVRHQEEIESRMREDGARYEARELRRQRKPTYFPVVDCANASGRVSEH